MKQLLVSLWFLLLSPGLFAAEPDPDPAAANKLLGRGMNLGNALEAPKEGDWGIVLEADYFHKIKEAGFNSVRIPIRWSAHAGKSAPFTIDPVFFKRVDWAIDQALTRNLAAVINVHHYDEIFADPDTHQTRLIGLWKQIAERYKDRPPGLFFEILNEPHGALTDDRWNRMIPPVLATIRQSNPRRMVVVGPDLFNNISQLDKLKLPEDRGLIVTVHYYLPFHFTHQGTSWIKGSDKWKGTPWKGTPAEVAAIQKDLGKAAAWGKKNNRPIYLGEFGAYEEADMPSRAAWTRTVCREAEKLGFSWSYWEFCSGFAAYDVKARSWHRPLLNALTDKQP